jgi:hypothetical protein
VSTVERLETEGALNPVRDLSLNGINPALRGGTRNYSKI